MTVPIRTIAFAAVTAATWAADARYRDAAPTPTAATVREQGNRVDDAAFGGTALAAVVCLSTWRPRGAATDRRDATAG